MDEKNLELVTCIECGAQGPAYLAPLEGYDYDRAEAHQGLSDEEFDALGGFSRSGTAKKLCENCDPMSWQNLPEDIKAGIEMLYVNVVKPLEEMTGSAEVAKEIFFSSLTDKEQ